jgi:hypothetical protein
VDRPVISGCPAPRKCPPGNRHVSRRGKLTGIVWDENKVTLRPHERPFSFIAAARGVKIANAD